MDQAGSCFFERQAAAGFSREQDSGCQAQVGFMADTERDGVRRQRIQEREQGAGCRCWVEFAADPALGVGANQGLKNDGSLLRTRQGT